MTGGASWPGVSNGDFLGAVFGADWKRAHVTGFSCDPVDAARQWRGEHAARRLNTLLPSTNNYYAVSAFSGQNRQKGEFAALHVIVFDDVGAGASAKVPPERILARGLQPSYRLETSQGNEQWGFILAVPETDLARAEAAIDGFIKSELTADGKDPGQSGVTRYVRLPVGRNTKAKYGPGGFSCQLTEWAPTRRYRLDAICAAWGIDLAGAALGAAGRRQPRPNAEENDLLAALKQLGLVLWEDRGSGTIHIRCPFVDEHTGGGETGTAYLPGGGIKCHHGHCQDRKTPDFIARIKETLAEQGDGGFMARRAFERAELKSYNALFHALLKPSGGLQDWLATGAAMFMDSDEIKHAVEGAALFTPMDVAATLRQIDDAKRQAQPVSRDEALAQMAAAEAAAVARMPLGMPRQAVRRGRRL
jgi:hypothetical protein